MKNIVFALSLICLLTSCSGPKDLPTITNFGDTKVEVKVSHQTTQSEMDEIVNQLQRRYKAQFSYEGSRFFENGKLRDLQILFLN